MIYSVELYIWGEKGLLAYNDLDQYRQRIERNIESLDIVHENLRGEFESLKGDSEMIAMYARELGYYRSGENQIIIQEMDLKKSHYIVGEIVKPYHRERAENQVFGIIACLFGATAYIILRFREGL